MRDHLRLLAELCAILLLTIGWGVGGGVGAWALYHAIAPWAGLAALFAYVLLSLFVFILITEE